MFSVSQRNHLFSSFFFENKVLSTKNFSCMIFYQPVILCTLCKILPFRKHFHITKQQENLMDFKFHFFYGCFLIFVIGSHQLKNVFLEIFYEEIGIEWTFQIWLHIYLIQNVGKYLLMFINYFT